MSSPDGQAPGWLINPRLSLCVWIVVGDPSRRLPQGLPDNLPPPQGPSRFAVAFGEPLPRRENAGQIKIRRRDGSGSSACARCAASCSRRRPAWQEHC